VTILSIETLIKQTAAALRAELDEIPNTLATLMNAVDPRILVNLPPEGLCAHVERVLRPRLNTQKSQLIALSAEIGAQLVQLDQAVQQLESAVESLPAVP
jgi:hypothetical protein